MKIEGVVVKELAVHQDIPDTDENVAKPGFLMEVLRDDDDLLRKFGQCTFTVAYKDTIKAFHWHKKQDDLWFVASGKAHIVLHDLRQESPTCGTTETVTAGEGDYKLIEFFEDGQLELYNLREDIGEDHDLAATEPETRDRLHAQLKAWREKVEAKIPQPNPAWPA